MYKKQNLYSIKHKGAKVKFITSDIQIFVICIYFLFLSGLNKSHMDLEDLCNL